MRIQLLTHAYEGRVSPPQRRWKALNEIFSNSGHKVDVIYPSRQYAKADHFSGVTEASGISRYPFRFGVSGKHWSWKIISHLAMVLFMVPKALSAPKPSLVIATVPALPTLVAGFLVAKIRRVPLIVEMRDAWPELLFDSGVLHNRFAAKVVAGGIRFIQRSADLVVAVTPGHCLQLSAALGREVVCVPNGYKFSALDRRRTLSHTDPSDKLRILYLGNLGESQGLDKLISFSHVNREVVDLKIVGDGSAANRLKELAQELGLRGVFFPPVKGSAVLDWYDWADTCVVSLRSDWRSFDHTVPSKLYELAGYRCHITGLVSGEASELIRNYGLGDVIDLFAGSSENKINDLSARVRSWQPNYKMLKKFENEFNFQKLGEQYLSLLKRYDD